jgi:hypothetical protein
VNPFRSGDSVACKINYPEKNGFAVTVLADNLPGFIKTEINYRRAEEIVAVYVGFYNGRIMLTDAFSYKNAEGDFLEQSTIDWAGHLTDEVLGNAYAAQERAARKSNLKMLRSEKEPEANKPETNNNVIQVNFSKRKKDD